jgi:hypothetical protein
VSIQKELPAPSESFIRDGDSSLLSENSLLPLMRAGSALSWVRNEINDSLDAAGCARALAVLEACQGLIHGALTASTSDELARLSNLGAVSATPAAIKIAYAQTYGWLMGLQAAEMARAAVLNFMAGQAPSENPPLIAKLAASRYGPPPQGYL